MENARAVVTIREANDSHMNHEVVIIITYEEEGSNGMVAVEALADVRKILPDQSIALIVEDETGIHSTLVKQVDLADVTPIGGWEDR